MSRSNIVESYPFEVAKTLQQYQMCVDAKRIVVGFSGGADSMMLLHFASSNAITGFSGSCTSWSPRAEEADRDEKAVELFCEKLKIPLKSCIQTYKTGKPIGNWRRRMREKVRYSFNKLANEQGEYIATAHTLSDVCETVLLHMTRGTGLKGLCGIPAIRHNIVRPLIGITRDEVEQYCNYYQLPYVTDNLNSERHYTRNRIRLDVVPILKQINPVFEEAILHLTQQCKDDMDYLEQQAADALCKLK